MDSVQLGLKFKANYIYTYTYIYEESVDQVGVMC